jgi:hypothetical protein
MLTLIHTFYDSLQQALSILSVLYLHRLCGNCFQRRRFHSFRVPRLRSSLPCACLPTKLDITSQRLITVRARLPPTTPPGTNVRLRIANCSLTTLDSSILSIRLASKSKLCYDRRSVGQTLFMSDTRLGPMTTFLLLSDS